LSACVCAHKLVGVNIAMDLEKLKAQWLAEENAVFKGWDFSHLEGRWQHDPLSWDYDKIVRDYKQDDSFLLDMGTGGGEYLLTLGHPYERTFVTEEYPPNVELCNAVLAPLGITVKQVFNDDRHLPFDDGFFDIIINRHEDFDMEEVARILKPGGIFITQQVGGTNGADLCSALVPSFVSQFPEHTLEKNVQLIESQGLEILLQNEEYPVTRFLDVGAVVYYAKVIEWEFPDFSVEKCFPQLCGLQKRLEEKGYVETREHRFIIVARKG